MNACRAAGSSWFGMTTSDLAIGMGVGCAENAQHTDGHACRAGCPAPTRPGARPSAMTPALALHPLFAGISSEARNTLERHLQTRRFEAGDIILRAGVPSAELFGLIDGAVRVELAGGGRRLLLVP